MPECQDIKPRDLIYRFSKRTKCCFYSKRIFPQSFESSNVNRRSPTQVEKKISHLETEETIERFHQKLCR